MWSFICKCELVDNVAMGRRKLFTREDVLDNGAGIEGRIEELTRDSRYETRVIGFMAGIRILVQGKSGRWTTVSEKDGRFQLWGLQPGHYRITAVLPRGFL